MKSMERLTIEYDGHYVPKELCTIDRLGGADDCEPCHEDCDKECSKCAVQKCFDKLAEYEDLEEQGLLLKLPVAMGSDVYYIPSKANFGLNVLHHHEELNRVFHQKIARVHFDESGWYAEGNLNLEYGVVDRVFVDKSYKETWFLTEQEAEAKLIELQSEVAENE